MKRLQLAVIAGMAVLATSSFAIPNIKLVDWGNAPADGTATINVVPQVVDLTHPLANVTYMNQVWGTRPGIFQFDVLHDYDMTAQRMYMLCVELEQGIKTAGYGYKGLGGYAGYLASQISNVVANPGVNNVNAAALGLLAWELNYDAYDPNTMTVNVANLDMSNGLIKYVQTAETLADYNAILAQANIHIAALQQLSPTSVNLLRYRYYADPVGNDDTTEGGQDYITSDVPGPLAAIPFLAGLVAAFRRKKR